MNMRIGSLRHWSPWLLALAAAAAPAPAQQDPAQQDPEAMERLRRDQEEILRKAERLHGMMQRLQQRYEREQKPEQVKLLQEGVAHLERSGLLREVAGIRATISRTGYTGDLGYELWCETAHAPALWDALMRVGKPHGIWPIGLDALDITRIEAGYILQGCDYHSALDTVHPAHLSSP